MIAAALERLQKLELSECFDASMPSSRPNAKQWEVLNDIENITFRWVIAGNQSGKTQLAAREIAWMVNRDHPFWVKPKKWGNEPLMILVVGQDRKNIELNIWNKKIKPFLKADEWKETRAGNMLQYATNLKTKDQIIFMSHAYSSERNRKYMQGYVAHYVWLDEMPGSIDILEELQRRVDAREGYFLATFTPKFSNSGIRTMVDAAKEPVAKKYRMSKLDNPIYAKRIEHEIAKLAGLPEYKKRTILYGDWMPEEGTVFRMPDNCVQMPQGYSRLWRHVEAVDPAVSSKMGYTLWAEDPSDGIWYCVKAEYIEGIYDPVEIYKYCMKLSEGHNIIRRVCDPHETWYLATATTHKTVPAYITPYNKNSRKEELIKGLQEKLGTKLRIMPECAKLITELEEARWSENTDKPKIVKGSKYHLLDASQYFADLVPKYEGKVETGASWYDELRQANEVRKKQESMQAQKKNKIGKGFRIRKKKQKPNGARILAAIMNHKR